MSPTGPGSIPSAAARRVTGLRVPLVLALLGATLLRCPAQPAPMPDFRLTDVNPNSARHTQSVSPRDYRLQIAAYYFGAAG